MRIRRDIERLYLAGHSLEAIAFYAGSIATSWTNTARRCDDARSMTSARASTAA
jgi:hypothetical protein